MVLIGLNLFCTGTSKRLVWTGPGLVLNFPEKFRTRTGPFRTEAGPGLRSGPKSIRSGPAVLGFFAVLGLDLRTLPVRPNETKFEDAPRPPLSALGEAEKAELVVTEGFDLETLSKTLSAGLTRTDFLLEGFTAPDVAPELEDEGPHSTAGVWSMYVHNVSRPGRRHVRDDLM